MIKETYGNQFRSGEKNIDDLHKSLIQDLMSKSKEEYKFNYVIKDVFEIMRNLGWSGDDTFEVQVDKTLPRDEFIVIKNSKLSPKQKSLPQSDLKEVKI